MLAVPRARVKIPKAFQDLLKTRARHKGFYGGRGSAKSHTFAEAAILAGAIDFKPKRILCCREIQRSIRESVKAVLDAKIIASGLTNFYLSTPATIRGANGTEFIFEGLRSNVTAIQSLEGIDIAWVEEANTVSRSSLDILIPTIRKPGSELWFSWNPRSANDPVDSMFRGAGAASLAGEAVPEAYDEWMISRRVDFADNPFFPDVLRAEMERDKRRDPDKYAHIWLGEYAKMSSARVFRNWAIGTREVEPGERPYFGADWGFAVDPSVLVRMYVNDKAKRIYIDAEAWKVGCRIEDTPALFDTIDSGMARYWPVKADSSRPEVIAYMQNHGYPKITHARKGPGSVEEGVLFLQNYDIMVHPNCRHVIDELTTYSYEVDKLTNEVLPCLADEKNHTIDACRYAVEDLRRAAKIAAPIVVSGPLAIYGSNEGPI